MKWVVSVPIRDSDLQKNFVCFNAKELDELLEEFSEATVQEVNSNCNSYYWKDGQLVVLNEEPVPFSLAEESLTLGEIQSIDLDTEQYIQVKDVYYSLDEFNRIGDYLLGRNLTDDQQVVLEWMKGIAGTDGSLIKAVYNLYHLNLAMSEIFKGNEKLAKVRAALRRLTRQQEAEVLAAFAEWGSKEEQS